jgi:hypothetical protein
LAAGTSPDTVTVLDKLQNELPPCRSDKRLSFTADSFSSRDSGGASKAFFHIIESVGIEVGRLAPDISVLLMFVLLQGYRQLNGRLAGREPALLHNSGLSVLTTWAPVLKPTDSPDPRLSELIANGDRFRLNDLWSRDGQLYSPGGLADRWKQIEPNAPISDQVAKADSTECAAASPNGCRDIRCQDILTLLEFRAHP